MSEMRTIGIIGDGQLGRMTAEVAIPLGHRVIAVGTAGDQSPIAQVGAEQLDGDVMDAEAIYRLAEAVGKDGVITLDLEQVNADALIYVESLGYRVEPSPRNLKVIQDKWQMKQDLKKHGIPVVEAMRLDAQADFRAARNRLGSHFMVKAAFGSFDGRGNLEATDQTTWSDLQDLQHRFQAQGGNPITVYAEEWIPFERELAIVGARGINNQIARYRPFQTIHRDSICHTVTTPANINQETEQEAVAIFDRVLATRSGLGVLAVEMFYHNGRVLVNEYARRVHNSGHVTQDAHETSQFELHLQAILGQELGSTRLKVPAAAMINILGARDGQLTEEMLAATGDGITNFVHLYGKDPRPKDPRKIGHVNGVGKTDLEALHNARQGHEIFGDPYAKVA